MASGHTLRKLIKAGSSGDVVAFRRASEEVIQLEREKNHHLLARELERILYADRPASAQVRRRGEWLKSPTDNERGLELIDLRKPRRGMEDAAFSRETMAPIEEIIEEQQRAELLRSYGMKPTRKALFFGPPGCGKTMAAEIIAYELHLPLAIVRIDAVVSSLLGETAVNLRKVFDFITEHPMVVLFDEFDALGKTRADNAEHGELRRVVNAVLQMMDAYQGESLIIAATNHEDILDRAVWRRFDEVIEFPLPNHQQLQQVLELKLRGVKHAFDVTDPALGKLFHGKSGADIERVARRAIKRMVLSRRDRLTLQDIMEAVQREMR